MPGMEKLLPMLNKITKNWSISRFIRLGIGLYLLVDGVRSGMILFVLLGVIFTILPLMNIGCCASNSCSVNPSEKENGAEDGVVFEEIKSKK